MMEPSQLLLYAQRLQAIAQAGLTYSTIGYDLERYEEIRSISVNMLREITNEPVEKIVRLFASETGYQTPKVDIRAVLFRGTDEVLMVREKIDEGRWTLPGGWADIGYTPFEVAAKEAYEETGLLVKPLRLLALLDKRKYAHPPDAWYIYKVFIQCEIEGGELQRETNETGGSAWFRREQLPSLALSEGRITLPQLEALFPFASNPNLPVLCD